MNVLPITIDGGSLGQRHHNLNKLVDEAVHSNVSLESIKQEQNSPPLDRLYKIKIASKYKNTDYIIQCLQDEDMLYVSEALKNVWFIQEAREVIQPAFLEENLYPNMSTGAISKMKNKIYLHLKDETQCEQFHKYYKKDHLKYALKFLPKCSESYILSEMESIPEEITSHYLKLLCEKTPKAAQLYFEKIVNTPKGHCTYMGRTQGKRSFGRSNDSNKYMKEIKFLLKTSPEIYIDILEKYFCDDVPLSAQLTRYFMRYHKNKFFDKPELYMSKILNVTEIARHLTKEEIKEVVIKAARAEYLAGWFNYKKVEPLLKRLEKKDKSVFTRIIFVNKEFGAMVKEAPYPFPKEPELLDDGALSVGELPEDLSDSNCVMDDCKAACFGAPAMMMKRKCRRIETRRTLLDELFDKYRFWNFSKTFFELRKRLAIESDPKNRMMIMNVLVSKSGGVQEQVLLIHVLLYSNVAIPVLITIRCDCYKSMNERPEATVLDGTLHYA